MEAQKKPLPARDMHKIVWIMLGVFALIAGSYPTAMLRVSQMEKFRGFHVKSLPVEGQPVPQPSVAKADEKNLSGVAPANLVVSQDEQNKQAGVAPANLKDSAIASSSPAAWMDDLAELAALKQKVYSKIDQSWKTLPTFHQSLVYSVSVTPEGAIVSYEPINQHAQDFAQETPLPLLSESPTPESASAASTPLGKFTVVFAPSGVLEVTP